MKNKLILMIVFAISISFMKAQSWQVVGYGNFSAGITNYMCIAVDPAGTPYVAYMDANYSMKLTVMKYDGSSWVNVSSPGFSSGQARYISIDTDNSGTPYVSYYDTSIGKLVVQKHTGSAWVNVGLYPSVTSVAFTSLKIDNSGLPYVAFQDGFYSDKVTVKKFDGTNWNTLGTSGFSAGQADYVSLQLDNSGTPYVGFQDYGNSSMATVMKFDGINWVDVGLPGFSPSSVEYTALDIDPIGTPYIAFKDNGSSNKISVMKFDGTSWVSVGTSGFSVGSVGYVDLLIDANGIPYVTYQDSFFSNRPFVQYFNGTNWVGMSSGLPTSAADFTSLGIHNSTLFFSYQDGSTSFEANVLEYALPIGIQEQTFEVSTTIAPNPFNAVSYIELGSPVKEATLTIYNNSGCIVKKMEHIVGTKITLQRGEMIPGTYIYVLTEEKEYISRGEFVIVN